MVIFLGVVVFWVRKLMWWVMDFVGRLVMVLLFSRIVLVCSG